MADRTLDTTPEEVPEIPELLEKVILYVLDEGKQKLSQGDELVPFTALVVKENLFIETHPGDSAEACFAAAEHTVKGARGADAYALCYDGYVETDDGAKDAVIAEGGIPGEDSGFAVAYLYTLDGEDVPTFETEPAYIGESPNYMSGLKESAQYDEEEIDEKYLEDEDGEFEDDEED